jgi:hypothetical protein
MGYLKASMRWALLAAGFLLVAGCDLTGQNTNQSNTGTTPRPAVANDDPLKGAVLPPTGLSPAQPTRTAQTTPNPQTQTAGGVPPIPPPSATPSTGALASGKVQGNLLADGRDIRITGGTSAPTAAVPATAGEAWERSPRSTPGVGVALTGSSGNADAWNTLQAELKKRNVVRQKLEQLIDGQWKFTCSVPSPKDATLFALITSQSPDSMEAIRQAIYKIDNPEETTPPIGPSHP